MIKAKLYKLINTILSILFGFLAAYYIYTLFIDEINGDQLLSLFHLIKDQPLLLLFVFLLMPINWLIETQKWRIAIHQFQVLSWTASIASIGLGILLSLFTPNRLGELVGRLLHIEKGKKIKILYSNILSAISQLQITVLMGLIAALYFSRVLALWIGFPQKIVIVLIIIAFFLSVYIYFSSGLLAKILKALFKHTRSSFSLDDMHFSVKLRAILLAYSFLRFLVFSLQFVLLLVFLQNDIQLINAFMFVGLLYFAMAIIPSTWLTELPIRSSLAYFIFSQLGYDGLNALLVSLLIWTINLLFPALLGVLTIPKINWLRIFKLREG